MRLKADFDRSITRPRTKGPRSLMVTTTLFPLLVLVTFTTEPKGSFLWAAVLRSCRYGWPLAVF